MSVQQLLIVLGAVWIACLVLGAILHLVKFLVYLAFVVTLVIAVIGLLRRRP